MTQNQYEQYKQIHDQLKPIRSFLQWCEAVKSSLGETKLIGLRCLFQKKAVALYKNAPGTVTDNTFEIPADLQERIVSVVKEYLKEQEQILEEL